MPAAVNQILSALFFIVVGTAGIFGFFLLAEFLIRRLPEHLEGRLRPWIYVGPTLLFLGAFLVYPVLETLRVSFLDRRSEAFVGVANYVFALTANDMLVAIRNNVLWVVLATTFAVGFGLAVAVLTDRVRYESAVKSVIFVPMAISMVGAGVIWRFIYAFRPAGTDQIGLLNGVLSLIPNFEPIGWLIEGPILNNIALITAFVWIWTGFCMVILSAALKGVPTEILEAARVDGATEWQVFRRVTIPMIASTIAVVATTMVITILKVFDIVYVMTNGAFDTEVIANRMYKEMFNFQNFGRASAIAVILLLAIVPVMILNIRRFQEQEAIR